MVGGFLQIEHQYENKDDEQAFQWYQIWIKLQWQQSASMFF